MAELDQDLLLGRLAVHYKVLSKEQAHQALRLWRATQSDTELAEFLVAESYVPAATMEKLVRARSEYLRRQEAKAVQELVEAEPAAAPQGHHPIGATTVRLTPDMLAAARVAVSSSGTAGQPTVAIQVDSLRLAVDEGPLTPPSADEGSLVIRGEEAGLFPTEELTAGAIPMEEISAGAIPMEEISAEAIPMEPELELMDALAGDDVTVGEVAGIDAVAEPAGLLDYGPGLGLEELLRRASELGASDLHVHSGAPLKVRVHGELRDASPPIESDAARELVYGILTAAQRQVLEEQLQLDFAFAIPGTGRFRANSYFQHRGLDGVFRIIPFEPPTLASLGLPESLQPLSEYHQGMVLFTGPAGCGKSSTMAAMVRLINESRPEHVLTIEDPIEYVHVPQRAVVNQREVGPHTGSFARALRAALREDPDVIVIGELRDLETVQLALTAAETGHLVLGTLHTASTVPTINRLVGVFPPDQQAQIRTMVSESLRAIVSQRLVPRRDGAGRVAALEILMNTKAVGNLIRDNRTFQINSVLQTGGTLGMCQLDASLANLVKDGVIAKDVARREAIDPKRFA